MSQNKKKSPHDGATDGLPRNTSESHLPASDVTTSDKQSSKPWERSQSALDLKNKDRQLIKASSVDYMDGNSGTTGTSVSEHSTVYWDLSKAEEEMAAKQAAAAHAASNSPPTSGGNKFKISLQTIHQKQEMHSDSGAATKSTSAAATTTAATASPKLAPKYSVTSRMVRRTSCESTTTANGTNTVTEVTEYSLPAPSSGVAAGGGDVAPNTPPISTTSLTSTPPISKTTTFKFTSSHNKSKPNLSVTLSHAVPILQENIKRLQAPSVNDQKQGLTIMLDMMQQAWATPQIGRDLAYGLCDVLRNDGGLEILIQNCDKATQDIQLSSAKVLEQSLTVQNRDEVAKNGLEVVVRLAHKARNDVEMTKAATGILENLFKHSEHTCSNLIKYGGLESLLYSIRTSDTITLRHCAVALANLAIYGGRDNQSEMITHKAAEWLFPLAFSSDDSIRYYAFLAIAALSANKELEQSVAQSGTLELVESFIRHQDPAEFAHSDKAHIHGQSTEWLKRLVPLLTSKRPEAQSLAAFHFAMEAGIKESQGHSKLFTDIGAIAPLKQLAASTNKLASKFAIQALTILGEAIPYKLTAQVPLWTVVDVQHWLTQVGFGGDLSKLFHKLHVDGDILLQLNDVILESDLQMSSAITRIRFLRELNTLKKCADYQSCDPSKLTDWLKQIGGGSSELKQYSYQMLSAGLDMTSLRYLTDQQLDNDCHVSNGVHRMKILQAAKRVPPSISCGSITAIDGTVDGLEKPLDCFISYRRINGSQLASLLKVHLQVRGFSVFLDIERLRAGKFDDNLMNNVRNARNFVLVLTSGALDRCVGDDQHRDWIHREIVAALEGGCNIVPVTDHNFEWPKPETLPEDMRAVCFFNGIRWIHDYQDACVEKLEKFMNGQQLISTPGPGTKQIRKPLFTKPSSESPEIHGGAIFQLGGSSDYAISPPLSSPQDEVKDCGMKQNGGHRADDKDGVEEDKK